MFSYPVSQFLRLWRKKQKYRKSYVHYRLICWISTGGLHFRKQIEQNTSMLSWWSTPHVGMCTCILTVIMDDVTIVFARNKRKERKKLETEVYAATSLKSKHRPQCPLRIWLHLLSRYLEPLDFNPNNAQRGRNAGGSIPYTEAVRSR